MNGYFSYNEYSQLCEVTIHTPQLQNFCTPSQRLGHKRRKHLCSDLSAQTSPCIAKAYWIRCMLSDLLDSLNWISSCIHYFTKSNFNKNLLSPTHQNNYFKLLKVYFLSIQSLFLHVNVYCIIKNDCLFVEQFHIVNVNLLCFFPYTYPVVFILHYFLPFKPSNRDHFALA